MSKQNESKKVNAPEISEETMKEMAKFFMRTSIPRILAERRTANEENTRSETPNG